jgi:hypothetical protein
MDPPPRRPSLSELSALSRSNQDGSNTSGLRFDELNVPPRPLRPLCRRNELFRFNPNLNYSAEMILPQPQADDNDAIALLNALPNAAAEVADDEDSDHEDNDVHAPPLAAAGDDAHVLPLAAVEVADDDEDDDEDSDDDEGDDDRGAIPVAMPVNRSAVPNPAWQRQVDSETAARNRVEEEPLDDPMEAFYDMYIPLESYNEMLRVMEGNTQEEINRLSATNPYLIHFHKWIKAKHEHREKLLMKRREDRERAMYQGFPGRDNNPTIARGRTRT